MPDRMLRREIGRTGVRLSAVGFGTASLRLVTGRRAVEALRRGFELGVDWVHTAPDYDGAERPITQAIRGCGRAIEVVSQATGDVASCERAFDAARRMSGLDRLALFGVNCIDEAEQYGFDVWGPRGMVEWLRGKKARGSVGAAFCSTHGPPEYVEKLLRSGAFDAVMLSYNPLGFHALSYHGPAEGREYEDIRRTESEILPLALELGVGILAMKPLGGGLLCRGKAFPAHERFSGEREAPTATDVLRAVLTRPGVTAALPGTASVEEAEENALAACGSVELDPERRARLERTIAEMRATLCSRCGKCETTCSRSLPISWMFRGGYIWSYRSLAFEDVDRRHYFAQHPDDELSCHTCSDRTCLCEPQGVDIPAGLSRVHARMLALREEGKLTVPPARYEESFVRAHHVLRKMSCDLPRTMRAGEARACFVWVQNLGTRPWSSDGAPGTQGVEMAVMVGEAIVERIRPRETIPYDVRTHFAFELVAPERPGGHRLRIALLDPASRGLGPEATVIHDEVIEVRPR